MPMHAHAVRTRPAAIGGRSPHPIQWAARWTRHGIMLAVVIGGLDATPARSATTPSRHRWTGSISLHSSYLDSNRPLGFGAGGPVSYSSNSRLSLALGRTQLSASLNRPSFSTRSSEPDRYFTLEISNPRFVARYGDLSPQFTSNTAGSTRVFGGELRLRFVRWIEFSTVSGISQRATESQGYMLGGFRQDFRGHRMSVRPGSSLAFGLTAARLRDDGGSAAFYTGPGQPRAQENLLLGSDASLWFLKRQGSLSLEYVGSVFTGDRSAGRSGARMTAADGSARGLALRSGALGWTRLNDSTQAGELFGARLVLPLAASRVTLEYRRTSPLFRSLALPYEPADGERIRVQDYTRLLRGALVWSLTADLLRTNVSRNGPVHGRTLNLHTTFALDQGKSARWNVSWRQNGRENDALPPAGRLWDPRINSISRGLSIARTQPVRFRAIPGTVTQTLAQNEYFDRVRPGSTYQTYSAQIEAQTQASSRLLWTSRVLYSETDRPVSGVTRNASDVYLKHGLRQGAIEFYLSEGLSMALASDGREKRTTISWGAGGRWSPRAGSTIELEWQSTDLRDAVSPTMSNVRRALEVRMNRGL